MDYSLKYVIDENGNEYVVTLEIKRGNKSYYLTKGGLFTKNAEGKYERAPEELNEKYMSLLKNPKKGEYVIVKNIETREKQEDIRER